ncbi:hypothetical protein D3C85_1776860 [compost metagenome]
MEIREENVDLRADQNPRFEIEAVVMNSRVFEACPARQLRVPDVQALIALQLNLHEPKTVQGDFVGHYVIDDHQ